jgi:HEAT repeat protein
VRWALVVALAAAIAPVAGCDRPLDRLTWQIRHSDDDPKDLDSAIAPIRQRSRKDGVAAALVPLLKNRDPLVRARAAYALAKVQVDVRVALPALIEVRRDREPNVRLAVTQALGALRPLNDEIISALIRSLEDGDPGVRYGAIETFCEIGPAGEKAIPVLLDLLEERAPGCPVSLALGSMGPKARHAVPALIVAMEKTHGYDRVNAAAALWRVDGRADLAVPVLIEALGDSFLPLRRDAALILGDIGPAARSAVPALISARDEPPRRGPKIDSTGYGGPPVVLQDTGGAFYPEIRRAAIVALEKINGEPH